MRYIATWGSSGRQFKAIVLKTNDKRQMVSVYDCECKILQLVNEQGFNDYADRVGVRIGRVIPFLYSELTKMPDPVDILKEIL